MGSVRILVRQHKWLASLLVACVLFAKVLIPAGFMPVVGSQGIVVQLCNGVGAETVTIAIPGKSGPIDQNKADSPCAFSGLAAPVLAGADPVQLALAILFILAMGLRAAQPIALRSRHHLRPPLRGPPAYA